MLRVDPSDGSPADGNPFAASSDPATRLIYSYGHRNVQGLSEHPDSGEMWAVEHGPSRDHEINRLVAGGNAGWNPVPGYNEGVSMTNPSLGNTFSASYSTGRYLGRSPVLWSGGRMRGVHQAADGSLWVTSDNGNNDTITVLTLD